MATHNVAQEKANTYTATITKEEVEWIRTVVNNSNQNIAKKIIAQIKKSRS